MEGQVSFKTGVMGTEKARIKMVKLVVENDTSVKKTDQDTVDCDK